MTASETLVEQWAAWSTGPGWKSVATARAYRRDVLAFVRDAGVTDYAADVKLATFDDFVRRMQIAGLAPSTISTRLAAIKSFEEWAVDRDLLPKSHARAVKLPRGDRDDPEVVVLSPKELSKLYAAAAGQKVTQGKREPDKFFARRAERAAGIAERDLALLMVSYAAALRVSEAAGLRVSDVLAPDGRDGNLAIVIRSSKTSRRPSRPLYLGPVASRALLAWKATRSSVGRRGDSLFGLSSRACAAVFDRCVRIAGLHRVGRRLTPHALRSSRATHAVEGGMRIEDVAILLRHRDLQTVRRYVKAAGEHRRRFESLATLPEARGLGLSEDAVRPGGRSRKGSGRVYGSGIGKD